MDEAKSKYGIYVLALFVLIFSSGCGHTPMARDFGKRGLLQGHGRSVSSYSDFHYGVPLYSRRTSTSGYIWPLRVGYISSSFGRRERNMHTGIDIAAPRGTPVYAVRSGVVVYSGRALEGYGNLIIVKHDRLSATVYAHNDVNLVRRGQQIEQGRMIATVGSSGRATGPHLHFEVRSLAKPVDPLQYLNGPRLIQAKR